MAERELITKSTFQGLRRQAVAGRYASDTWHQIVGHLSARGMDDEAELFAEPFEGRDGEVSWYGAGSGDAVAASSLDPEAREKLNASLKARYEAVEAEAERLLASKKDEEKRMGALLQAALKFPLGGEDIVEPVWSLNDQPVLVNWGSLSDVKPGPQGPLQDYLELSKPLSVMHEPPVRPDEDVDEPEDVATVRVPVLVMFATPWLTWLLWILFALLTFLVFYLLLNSCGIRGLTGPAFCPRETVLDQFAGDEELQALVDAVELQAMRAPLCDEPTTPSAQEEDEIERRRAEAGAGTGDVTITLAWNSNSDLDLELICPDGTIVDYQNPSGCGARLDVDRNASRGGLSSTPIENIFLSSDAQHGRYRIRVHRYPQIWNDPNATPFIVRIDLNGEVEEVDGRLDRNGDRVQVYEFDYP